MAKMLKYTIEWKPVDVAEAEVLSLTEAAQQIGISASALADLCLRGRLVWLRDEREPNPFKQGRVLRADVLSELARRRLRRRGEGDARLRGRK